MATRQNHLVRSELLAHLRDPEEQAKFLNNARNVIAWTKQERSSAERQTFISLLSRSLRAPLNSIHGYAQLLDAGVRGSVTDEQRHDVHRVHANERHLLKLVDSVISFARWDSDSPLQLQDVSVRAALQQTDSAVLRVASEKGVVYASARAIAKDIVVRAEPGRLREILLQLMLNAVKFSRPEDAMSVDARVVGDRVWIRVTDTGIGIAEQDLALIFHPFVRGRDRYVRGQEGVGLGLAITRRLARAMGGDLSVVSAPSGGSTFTLSLPRGRGEDPGDPASRSAPPHSPRR